MPPNLGTATTRRPHQQQQNKNHNNNDLKSLRAQFRHSLSSLTELFPEWSQDDLLFVMDECQGDLDLAITRITEGYANQWGQVKSKKPNNKKTLTNKPNGEPFSNRGSKSKGNGKNFKNKKPKREKSKEITVQPVPEEELKPSWASIAKGHIKSEEVVVVPVAIEEEKVVVNEQVVDETTANEVTVDEEAIELVAVDEQVSKEEAITEEPVSEQVITVEAVKEEAVDEEAVNQEPVSEEVAMDLIKEKEANESNEEKKDSQDEEEKESSEEKESNEQVQTQTTTIKRKPTAIRRLNQVEAVVLPGNQQEAVASLSSVNVQFGSLNLNQSPSDSEIEEEVNETVIQQKEQVPVIKEVPVAKEPVVQQTTKEPIQPQVVVQAPIVQPQVVAPPPNQPVLQESYTSANYSTFIPNTMSAYHYGIITPTTTAEYTVYNPEPQRMNYYDPNLYHSPSVNVREKYNTPPPVAPAPIPMMESTIIHHQPQPFNHNTNSTPYYYSYYNNQPQQPQQNYQPIGYQTYVNKTMYNPPITTTAATAISTATAAPPPPPAGTVAPVTNPLYINKSNSYEYHHHQHHSYEEQQQQQQQQHQLYYNQQQQQQTEMMYHHHHYQPQPYFAYNNNTSNHLPQQQQQQQQPVFQPAPPPPPPQRQPYWHQA